MGLLKKIVFGTFTISSGNILTAIFGFLSTLFFIQALALSDYGLLILALAAYGIMDIFLDVGLATVLISDIAHERGRKRFDNVKKLVKNYIVLELAIGVLLAVLVFLFSPELSKIWGSQESIAGLLNIIALMLFLDSIKNVFRTTFLGYSLFKYSTLVQVTESLSRLLILLGLIATGSSGVVALMLAYPLSMAIAVLVGIVPFLRLVLPLRKEPKSKEPVFRNVIFGHGKYAMIAVPAKKILVNGPPWIIEAFLGLNAVAIFGVANKVYSFISSVFGTFDDVLSPLTASEIVTNKEHVKKLNSKIIKYSLMISLVIILLAVLFTQPFFRVLLAEKYAEAATDQIFLTFWVLLMGLVPLALGMMLKPITYAIKRQQLHLYYIPFSFATIFGLGSLLTPLWGVPGMAFSVFLSAFFSVVVTQIFLSRYDKAFSISWRDMFSYDEEDRKLFARISGKTKLSKRFFNRLDK